MDFQTRQAPRLAAIIAALCVNASLAIAGPFSDLIVFGDSLSDVGNVAHASFDIYPGRHYYDDRFSNGPVWLESLSIDLGLGPLQRSTAGGDNFAYGGAQTTGTGGLEGFFISDIDEQVTQYLGARSPDPAALFVVFAGSNDLIGGQTNTNVPVSSLAKDISRLVAAGARRFLVPNLPLLGFTPRFNDSEQTAAEYNQRTAQFNAALDVQLEAIAAGGAGPEFYRLDVAALFTEAIADPAAFGLTNVTDAAAPGLEPGAASYNASQIVSNPNQYMFWDDLHPTAAVHTILAHRALALLEGAPGDFDANGMVNAGDLATWKTGFGTSGNATRKQGDADNDHDVDGADFLLWQQQLDSMSATRTAGAAVPEPGVRLMLMLACVGVLTKFLRLRREPRTAAACSKR